MPVRQAKFCTHHRGCPQANPDSRWRELEVFRGLGQGKGVRLISEELGVTIATVNSCRNRIKEKPGLRTSTEVMLYPSSGFEKSLRSKADVPRLRTIPSIG